MDNLWLKLRKNFIPTSTDQQLKSLQNLLGHFCKSDVVYKTAKLSNGYLNYVEVVKKPVDGSPLPSQNERPKRTLLLMHGFGSGLGFFFNNYDDLAVNFDRVISVDWLGMGASSRSFNDVQPRLTVYDQIKTMTTSTMNTSSQQQPSTTAAVDFFVDSLEEMRCILVKEGSLESNDSLHLAGHSLGGYLAARYALKYPHNIKSLILVSPVGLPDKPAVNTRAPSSQLSWAMYISSLFLAGNFTPQSVVRMAGPRGEGMVRGVLDRRFGGRWSTLELDLISSYLYHISAAPPLGEYSLNSLLEIVTSVVHPTASDITSTSTTLINNDHSASIQVNDKPKLTTFIYAREPLINSLHKLPKKLPVLLLFGDTDWLYNPRDIIHRDVNRLKAGKINLTSSTSKKELIGSNEIDSYNGLNEVKLKGGIDITLQVIPDAGHHIYLDNRKGFSHSITQWLKIKKLF